MTRNRRSSLVVPASSERKLAKAATLLVDQIVIDLEDAVVPQEKTDLTRQRVANALLRDGWRSATRAVRVNEVRSRWFEDDVRRIVELAGDAVHSIVLPKVETSEEVGAAVALLDELGATAAVEVQIESAHALIEVERIAASSRRLEAMIFGPGDYAASVGVAQTIGSIDPAYPGDQWHYARSRISAAAHAFKLDPIDGPYAGIGDETGLRESARRARLLGFVGKWVIHPSQVGVVEDEFTPDADEIAWARRTLEALDDARRTGHGAVALDGVMLDDASRRSARGVLTRAGLG